MTDMGRAWEYRPLLKGEKIRIAFLFQIASFWPSWESLFRECERDERFDVRLYLVQDGVDVTNHTQSAEAFLKAEQITYYTFADLDFQVFSPHIAIVQTPYEYLHRRPHLYSLQLKQSGIRVVYIPYGIELADTAAARHDHFREPVIRNSWRIYTLSDAFAMEYHKYCENAAAVRAFGLPRFDTLCHSPRYDLSSDIKERIGNRKVIVWHAHFAKRIFVEGSYRQVTPYIDEYLAFADLLVSYQQYFFIFLPHPRFGDDAVDVESNMKSALLLRKINCCPNAMVDRADDYRPVLFSADAIITDRSAIMVESALAGVPVLYLSNPDFQEPLFPPLVSLIDSYDQGSGCNDIVRFLNGFERGEDVKKPMREACLRQTIPYLDGKCAQRIRDDFAAGVESNVEAPTQPEHLRIIIFGTGFLYQKIMSFFRFPAYCTIVALTDNDSARWHGECDGISIIPPDCIQQMDFDKIIIMAGNVFEEQIYKQLRFDLEIPETKIAYCDYIATL